MHVALLSMGLVNGWPLKKPFALCSTVDASPLAVLCGNGLAYAKRQVEAATVQKQLALSGLGGGQPLASCAMPHLRRRLHRK